MDIVARIGLDIGQRSHPSAICVAQCQERGCGERCDVHFSVRHLEKMPAGTTYPQIAKRLSEIKSTLRLLTVEQDRLGRRQEGAAYLAMYVNCTGVGLPIAQYFCRLAETLTYAVYFTHGDRRSREKMEVTLGKAYLVARLQLLLQCGRLHLLKNQTCKQLADDLLEYQINVPADANERYGAFRVGSQDHLVTALGLAVQTDFW